MRREWGVAEGRTVLLYAGRWSREKRLGHLPDALPDATLVVMGDGPDHPDASPPASAVVRSKKKKFW